MTQKSKYIEDLLKLPTDKFKKHVRKNAISNVKENTIAAGKDINSLSKDEIKELIADEEKNIISNMKSKGLIASAGAMALNLLNPISIAKNFFFDEEDLETQVLGARRHLETINVAGSYHLLVEKILNQRGELKNA